MESLSFKHAPIRIGSNLNNLSYIVATNANFSTTNSINELKSLGRYFSSDLQFPSNYITNNFSFQDLIENEDPIKNIIEILKSGQFDQAPSYYVDIGGLTFREAYLESFSLTVNPSTVASAQATFVSFLPASGQFGKSQLNPNQIINADFLHGDSANISLSPSTTNNSGEDASNYYGLSYNLRTQYLPITTLGSSYPKTIKYNGAVEELELTENLYRRILYSGDMKSITVNMSAVCAPDIDYTLSISNAQSISVNGNVQNNGVVTTLRKFTKYY
jgi:hypothetical protein